MKIILDLENNQNETILFFMYKQSIIKERLIDRLMIKAEYKNRESQDDIELFICQILIQL